MSLERPVLCCDRSKSKVQKAAKNECDINKIVGRARKNGGLLPPATSRPMFGNFYTVPDLIKAHDVIIAVDDSFYALPSNVRDRFGHDPMRMVEFLQDPKNEAEAIKLGIVVPKEDPKPPEAAK